MGTNSVYLITVALPVMLVMMGIQLLMIAAPVSLLLKNRFVRAWRVPTAVRWVIVQAVVYGVWIVLAYVCGGALNGLASGAGGF